MKRTLAFLAALTLAFGLCACSSKTEKQNNSSGGGDVTDITTTDEEFEQTYVPTTSLNRTAPIPQYEGTPNLTHSESFDAAHLNFDLPDNVRAEETDEEIILRDDEGKWELHFRQFRDMEGLTYERDTDFENSPAYRQADTVDTVIQGFGASVRAANVNDGYVNAAKGIQPQVDIIFNYGTQAVGKWNGMWVKLVGTDPSADDNIYSLLASKDVRAVLNNFEIVKGDSGIKAVSGGISLTLPSTYVVTESSETSAITAIIDDDGLAGGLTVGTVKAGNIQNFVMAAAEAEGVDMISGVFNDREYIGFVQKAPLYSVEVTETVENSEDDENEDEEPVTVTRTEKRSAYIINLYGVYSDDRALSISFNLFDADLGQTYAFLDSQSFVDIINSLSIDPSKHIDNGYTADEAGFEISGSGLITGYTGEAAALRIPESIGGVPVIGIAGGAFSGTDSIESVSIPSSVAFVADSAFEGCENLTAVNFGSGTRIIGSRAFADCVSLEDLTLPKSVSFVSRYAFSNAGSGGLKIDGAVKFDDYALAAANFTSAAVGGYSDLSAEYIFSGSAYEIVSVGSGVRELGAGCISDCDDLREVRLPGSIKTLGRYAFAWDPRLNYFEIPAGVETVPDSCFDTTSLDVIIVPPTVKRIEYNAIPSANYVVLEDMDIELADNAIYADKLYLSGVYAPEDLPANFAGQNVSSQVFISMDASVSESDEMDAYLSEIGFGEISWIGTEAALLPTNSLEFITGDSHDLIGYEGQSKDMYIPFTISDGAYMDYIYRIGEEAFADSDLTSVYIHSLIDSMPDNVFAGSKSLKDIWFSGAVTRMDSEFYTDDCLSGLPDDVVIHLPARLNDKTREKMEKVLRSKGLPSSARFVYYTLDDVKAMR